MRQMSSDDPPLNTEKISSSCAQAFCDKSSLYFYHGTDAVAIAMALMIDKKADADSHGGLHCNNLLQHGRGLPITASFNI